MSVRMSLGTQSFNRLLPYVYPERAAYRAINLMPSQTVAKGTILGIVTDAANAVHTITDTPTITAGTFTLTYADPLTGATVTTDAIDFDATNAEVKAAIDAVISGTVTVAGSGLPGNDTTLTYSGNWAEIPVPVPTVDNDDLTGGTLAVASTTVGRSAAAAVPYDDAGTDDGRRTAVAIAQYDMESDANGNIYIGELTSGRFLRFEAPNRAVDAYSGGYFKTSELVGLDAAAVTDLNARLWKGTLADGVLHVPA